MAHTLFGSLSHFFHHYGYWSVLAVTLVENAGVPIPGETILLFASFLARRGDIHLVWAIAAAVAGSTLGECLGFLIGRVGGTALLEKHRKKLFISARVYERSQALFLRHAGWTILAARFVAGLRELVGILAGIFRMPVASFLLFNFTGAVVWSVSIGCVGYFLGGSWRRLLRYFARINIVALIAFAVVVLVLLIRHRRREELSRKGHGRKGPARSTPRMGV